MPTFLFTDIQASTRKWQQYGDAMRDALARHDLIISDAVDAFSGLVVKHTGDGFMTVFTNGRALECALAIQRSMLGEDWSDVGGLGVRIGINSGPASQRDGDYFGTTVSRTARLMSSGWGGQIVFSSAAASSEELPPGTEVVDMGVHMLRDLQEPQQIFTLSHPDIDVPHPPLDTVSSHPHNLPVQTTPFIGRERELAEIGKLLTDSRRRLITLLGYGGAGKTRTALQAAAGSVRNFRHGAWFVPLEEMDDMPSMVSVIADILSFRFSSRGSELDQLAGFLADRETLIVLDNFEHLTGHAPMLSGLLASCPGLKFLITSRQRLGIREENVYDLSGMELPRETAGKLDEYDATELFLSSAGRVVPNYAPGRAEASCIIDICGMLEGLPLAIELAASWIRTIPCVELKSELKTNLDILENTAGDLPARQRSIRSVFNYSWGLLSEDDRMALAGLSVFEGRFTRRAAAEVAGCGLRTLQRLGDCSLVRRGGCGRYSIHPLTRDFAAGKQDIRRGGAERLLLGHCRHYHEVITALKPHLHDGSQTETLNALSIELPNIRKGALTAHRRLLYSMIHDYISVFSHLLQIRSRFSEAVELFQSLLSAVEAAEEKSESRKEKRNALEAILKERISTFLIMSGRRREAVAYLQQALELSDDVDDPLFSALCRAGLGNIAYLNDDLDGADMHWSEAAAIARREGKDRYLSSLLCNMANVRKSKGDYERARSILLEVDELIEGSGDQFIRSSVLSTQADICRLKGDLRKAESGFSESLELSMKVGNLRGASYCLENLADILSASEPEEALIRAEESLQMAEKSGSLSRIFQSRLKLAELSALNGRFEEAFRLLDSAEKEVTELDSRSMEEKCAKIRSAVEQMRDRDAPG